MSLTVNGITASAMTWLAPWNGVWSADVVITGDVVPSGRVVIATTEGVALVGSVDPKHSGAFGEKRVVRVLGGGAGWGKLVRPQHYHSDVGVPLSVVATTTAAEVGEIVTVLSPSVVGTDYVRVRDDDVPASQIFEGAGVDWWVGLDGVTKVGVRLPVAPHPSLQVLDWDPSTNTMSFSCDLLVEPGTVIADGRFGTRIVREVEAVVSGGSVTGTLWVADSQPEPGASVSELVDSISAIANASTRAKYSRFYEYRVIAMAGDRVQLQSVSKAADGVPDILPVSVWAGSSGYRAKLRPGSRVLAGFRGGDASKPFVAFYEPPEGDGWRPVELEVDAVAKLTLGEQALAVQIGAGLFPMALMTTTFAAWIAGVTAAFAALGVVLTPPTDAASTKVTSS
jgi:hypothetical protein